MSDECNPPLTLATPQAAAPQPPQIISDESASTGSLIDVDAPSVHTVPSDFMDQDVQTDTQAERLDREAEAAKAKKAAASSSAKRQAKHADNWLAAHFAQLSDGSAGALAVSNLVAVVGLSSFLGYKAWGLYERGRLDWGKAGLGLGILAAVGAAEGLLGRYLYKGKAKGN